MGLHELHGNISEELNLNHKVPMVIGVVVPCLSAQVAPARLLHTAQRQHGNPKIQSRSS